jgi:hypothetical protein
LDPIVATEVVQRCRERQELNGGQSDAENGAGPDAHQRPAAVAAGCFPIERESHEDVRGNGEAGERRDRRESFQDHRRHHNRERQRRSERATRDGPVGGPKERGDQRGHGCVREPAPNDEERGVPEQEPPEERRRPAEAESPEEEEHESHRDEHLEKLLDRGGVPRRKDDVREVERSEHAVLRLGPERHAPGGVRVPQRVVPVEDPTTDGRSRGRRAVDDIAQEPVLGTEIRCDVAPPGCVLKGDVSREERAAPEQGRTHNEDDGRESDDEPPDHGTPPRALPGHQETRAGFRTFVDSTTTSSPTIRTIR